MILSSTYSIYHIIDKFTVTQLKAAHKPQCHICNMTALVMDRVRLQAPGQIEGHAVTK